ncbi:MAG: MFS transporter [Chloroherpetonaceae bacterium]|nr:MFS transporter [Chloroherpetonaceae bacterium]
MQGGTALSFFAGTAIDAALGWRWAFYIIGFAGLPIALLVLLLREPPRGVTETLSTPTRSDWRAVFKLPTLWLHHIGYACLAIAANSLTIWLPTYFVAAFGMAKTDVGFMVAMFVIIGGLGGTILGGAAADALRRRQRGGRLLLMSGVALVSVVLWLLFLFTEQLSFAQVLYFALMSTSLAWLGPAAADVHEIVGVSLRGIGVAVYFFVVNIIGYGIAPPIVGAISDALISHGTARALQFALLLCPLSLAISAAALWLASQRLNAQTALER